MSSNPLLDFFEYFMIEPDFLFHKRREFIVHLWKEITGNKLLF